MGDYTPQRRADDSLTDSIEKLSPIPERVAIASFMAGMALEAFADHMPNSVSAPMLYGVGILKAVGFISGLAIITTAVASKAKSYFRP